LCQSCRVHSEDLCSCNLGFFLMKHVRLQCIVFCSIVYKTCTLKFIDTPYKGLFLRKYYMNYFLHLTGLNFRRDSVFGIATGYGMDDREVTVRVPVGSRIFFSPFRPDRLWGPPNLLLNW
jgi:hypothetical protein